MNVTTVYSIPVPRDMPWWPIAAAAAELARGELILLQHDHRVVLVGCADTTTSAQMAFIARHTAGAIRVVLQDRCCDPRPLTGQRVNVETSSAVTAGVSGAVRIAPARVLAESHSAPSDVTPSGHVLPVRWNSQTPDHCEAIAAIALALTDAAIPHSSGAVCADLQGVDGPAGIEEAKAFAFRHRLTLVDARA